MSARWRTSRFIIINIISLRAYQLINDISQSDSIPPLPCISLSLLGSTDRAENLNITFLFVLEGEVSGLF